MKKYLLLLVVILLVSFFLFFFIKDEKKTDGTYSDLTTSKQLSLKKTCPPGFQLNSENKCINKNLYLQYESLEDKGVGGLKTALPKERDGFSPQQIDRFRDSARYRHSHHGCG